MHKCKYCNTVFIPRPQTKNPKACNNSSCQLARQRENEKEWHSKNKDLYLKNKRYHQLQAIHRNRIINLIFAKLLDCLEIGARFKDIKFKNINMFSNIFKKFISNIGVRKINKFLIEITT